MIREREDSPRVIKDLINLFWPILYFDTNYPTTTLIKHSDPKSQRSTNKANPCPQTRLQDRRERERERERIIFKKKNSSRCYIKLLLRMQGVFFGVRNTKGIW